MFNQLLESFRKASESSVRAQRELYRHWVQQWTVAPLNVAGVSARWSNDLQRHWFEFVIDGLSRHRELFDSAYRSGIRLVEQSFRVGDAKSIEDYEHWRDELWAVSAMMIRQQSEIQFHEFQRVTQKLLTTALHARV